MSSSSPAQVPEKKVTSVPVPAPQTEPKKRKFFITVVSQIPC